MLARVASPARLLHLAPTAIPSVLEALDDDWRAEALALLAAVNWRGQVVACAAILLRGSDGELDQAVWRALDAGSWAAPQLVATAFFVDGDFEARAEERLLAVGRRSPKTTGALVRAYHRLDKPRMNVVAQLGRHEPLLQTEEARIGIRGVDGWLDNLPLQCDAGTQARWLRRPRAIPENQL